MLWTIHSACHGAVSGRKREPRLQLRAAEDTRMVLVDAAIRTWVLKFAGIIESACSARLTEEGAASGEAAVDFEIHVSAEHS